MPTLLIEMPAGVAGDMLLAALLDLGGDRDRLLRDLAALGLGEIGIDVQAVSVSGIAAKRVDVRVDQVRERWLYGGERVAVDLAKARPSGQTAAPAAGDAAEVGGGHVHRPYRVIRDLIARSSLPERVRDRAGRAFRLLAEAEGAVHGVAPEDVEFHEVGGLDAIVDVVGACLLAEQLAIDQVLHGAFTPGEGSVRCAHGVMPVPVPAVAKLLAGARAPQRRLGRDVGELTTPTGCAIVLALVDRALADGEVVRATRVGHGAGHKRIEGLANAVRLSLLTDAPAEEDAVDELRCEVDDATGEQLAALVEELIAAGARDAYLTPVVMKKGRPGHLITALTPAAHTARLADLLLARSTTIGVRWSPTRRRILARRSARVRVRDRDIAIKIVTQPDGAERAKPEADDVAAAARALGLPFAEVQRLALAAWTAAQG